MTTLIDAPPDLLTAQPVVVVPEPMAGVQEPTSLSSLKIVTFPARMFLALGWLRAGVEKAIDVNWWTGFELERFLVLQRPHALPFMHPLIDTLFAPLTLALVGIVMLGQFAIGAALITGRYLRLALIAAMTLNVTFVAMGVVAPSAFYLVLQLTLLAALGERWRTSTEVRTRWARAAMCLVLALAMVPFANTLHPAEVIDDPALMLSTIALLCASVDVLRIAQRRLV